MLANQLIIMKKSTLHLLLLTILILPSCGFVTQNDLEKALKMSGENRSELEAVLFYCKNKSDIHYAAAVYLIENMPGHFSLTEGCMPDFIQATDSLYQEMPDHIRKVVFTIPQRLTRYSSQMSIQEDIKVIKSDFLISHIDNIIEMWMTCPWLKGISFDECCEYLLPYRFASEPLIPDKRSDRYWWKLLIKEAEKYRNLPYSMNDLRTFQRNIIDKSDDKYLQDLELPVITPSKHSFDCLDDCYYNLVLMRAAGIPSCIDFVSDWPTRNGRHYWRVLMDPYFKGKQISEQVSPRSAKVFRWTYSHNEIPSLPNHSTEYIPELFQDPFCKDVTEKYIDVTDVTIKPVRKIKSSYIYLAVFNDLQWKPVAWARIKSGKAVFHKMGKGLVYLPVYYEGREMKQVGSPFILDTDGKQCQLSPSKKLVDLTLTRKYPLNSDKLSWSRFMIDGRIEASNTPSFSSVDTLFVIKKENVNLNYMDIDIETNAKYRYWRYIHPNKRINIGELAFLDDSGKIMNGVEIQDASNRQDASHLAFDGDILTYTNIQRWFGKDFGIPVKVSKIRLISRTDGNGIIPGMIYELSYWDEAGEIVVGQKKATSDSIVFKNVPAGALYWLKNMEEGVEERIFTYENGVIRFW